MTIHQRLKALVTELQSPRLLKNQGNGNEIGYYIFDYDAEHEPIVEQFISELQCSIRKRLAGRWKLVRGWA